MAQGVEVALRDPAERAHPIAAQPAGFGQLQHARQPAVIGEKQEPFGADVEPADREQARQVGGQRIENGRASFRVDIGGHEPARLVVEEQPRALARRQRRPVDHDPVGGRHVQRGRHDHAVVDGDPAGRDPGLGFAPRREPGAGDHLGDAIGFLRGRRRSRGAARHSRGPERLAFRAGAIPEARALPFRLTVAVPGAVSILAVIALAGHGSFHR